MKVLITGGAGFLGQHLIYRLLQQPGVTAITVLDLGPPKWPVFGQLLSDSRLQYHFEVDITRPESFGDHFTGADTVLHLAGLVSFWKKHRELLYQINTEGTRHVISACQQAGVQSFVQVSSVAGLGYHPSADTPIDEGFAFDWAAAEHENLKHYMLSKKRADDLVLAAAAAEPGTRWLIAHPALMFGPGDLNNTYKLISGIRSGRFPAQPPGGTYTADVRDIARGLLALLAHGRNGERYILGSDNLSFVDMNAITAEVLRTHPPPLVLPEGSKKPLYAAFQLLESLSRQPVPISSDNLEAGFRCRYFSARKARQELSWQPLIPFRQSMADAWAWLQARQL